MREIKCRTCGEKFITEQKGYIIMCSKKCRRVHEKSMQNVYNHKRIKTGEDVASGIYFGNAKEPLMKVSNGFGFLGVISYNKTKDKIQCHICGKFFRSLNGGGHLKIHGISNDEYKEKFEISRTVALVSEGTRIKMLQGFLARGNEWKMDIKKISNDEHRRTTNLGKKRRIYSKNKTGHCPLQLLEPIKLLHEKLGFVPNGEDFSREYKGKYMSSIVQTYGSYNEALKICGFEPRPRCEFKYTEEELLEFLRNFYKEFKRTPSNTDFNRGYLPAKKHYTYRVGKLNRARAMADVPLMLQIGGWRWAEIPLTKELKEQAINNF